MRKALIFLAIAITGALAVAGTQSVRRLFSVARTFREVTFERAHADTLSLPGIAASVVGQKVLADLALDSVQQEHIARLYRGLRESTPGDSAASVGYSPARRRDPAPVAADALRDSIRAILTREQWKKLQNSRSAVATLRKNWTDYLSDPMVRDVMGQLDLTASQKAQMKSLAKVYTGDLATLLTISDPVVRRMRVEALFDDGWSQARRILTPDQQATVENYLATHREQIEAGLRGLWLQGL